MSQENFTVVFILLALLWLAAIMKLVEWIS